MDEGIGIGDIVNEGTGFSRRGFDVGGGVE